MPGFSKCLTILDIDMVLNMPEALNMPGFWICCNIVLITLLLLILVIFEFLSAQFVHPGPLQITPYLVLTRVKNKNKT